MSELSYYNWLSIKYSIPDAVDEPPANCTFSEWSEYGRCSVTCGGGLKVRRRRFLGVDNGASRVNCSGNLIETMSCSENECPGKEITKRVR